MNDSPAPDRDAGQYDDEIAEVLREHPWWTAEQVAAELRSRGYPVSAFRVFWVIQGAC